MFLVKNYLRIEFYVLPGYLVNKYVDTEALWLSMLLFSDIIALVEGNERYHVITIQFWQGAV